MDVTVAHPKELNQIANSDKKTDRVDAKELARMVRLNSVPESYVPTNEIKRSFCESAENLLSWALNSPNCSTDELIQEIEGLLV